MRLHAVPNPPSDKGRPPNPIVEEFGRDCLKCDFPEEAGKRRDIYSPKKLDPVAEALVVGSTN
jgi:hypothetical protein